MSYPIAPTAPDPFLPAEAPPHSVDVEQACLGAALISCTAAEKVADLCEPEDFYLEAHRHILSVVVDILADHRRMAEWGVEQRAVDTLSVPEALRQRGQLEAVGGIAYILNLEASVPTATHIDYYLGLLKEKSTERQEHYRHQRIRALTANPHLTLAERSEQIEAEITNRTPRGPVEIVAARPWMVATSAAYGPDAEFTLQSRAIPTGIKELDRMLAGGGLGRKKVSIIAGRPSMGKSMLVGECVFSAAWNGHPAGVISLEMPKEDFGVRLQCAHTGREHPEGGVPLTVILNHANPLLPETLTARQVDQLGAATSAISTLDLYIYDGQGVTLASLRALIRRMVQKHAVEIIFIDYLQLISHPLKSKNENGALTEILEQIQVWAREFDIHICVVSQLSREGERRAAKERRPIMADLRGTGSFEQVADVIMFVYRESYYERQRAGGKDDGRGAMEIIIPKQRQGPVGTAHAEAFLDHCRIADRPDYYTHQDAPPAGPRDRFDDERDME